MKDRRPRFTWSSATFGTQDHELLAHCYFRGALGASRVCDPYVTLGSASLALTPGEPTAPIPKCAECKRLLVGACV